MTLKTNPKGFISPTVKIKGNISSKEKIKGIISSKEKIAGKVTIGNYGVLDSNQVKEIVNEYLAENPPIPRITINGEGPDENGNFVIDISSSGADNIVEF